MRGLNVFINVFAGFMLLACDAAQQEGEQAPVTLEVDSGWVVKNELDNLATEIQQFLYAHEYPFSSLKQQDDQLILTYRAQPERDVYTDLRTSFAHLTMKHEVEKHQLHIQLSPKALATILEKARQTNMHAITKAYLLRGLEVTATPVGQIGFTLSLMKNAYDPALLAEIIHFQQLEFVLVRDEADREGANILKDRNQEPVYLEREPVLTGVAVQDAEAVLEGQLQEPALHVTLHDEEAEFMQAITQENIGRSMAIVLKSESTAEVVSVATIQGVFGKRFMIARLANMDEAKRLAATLRAGELAAPTRVVDHIQKTDTPVY